MHSIHINIEDYTPLVECTSVTKESLNTEIRATGKPIVMRNLLGHWPAVKTGRESVHSMAQYLRHFDSAKPLQIMLGNREMAGRYFYRSDIRGYNFEHCEAPVEHILDKLLALATDEKPISIYAGAKSAQDLFPSFAEENPLSLLEQQINPLIWIGNNARIAPHYDASENIAGVVCGKRRFLLFPPEQVENLYVGPLENTMAGQPSSMVDPAAPDFIKCPKYQEAIKSALVAELEPGDAIYIPALWWHYVESTGPLNVLANYWWNDVKRGCCIASLAHAVMVIRDLPLNER
ncbi:cupin-like domain-containing protein [Alteromonas oceanisediminis]|uniref:cupin-like domain-containing protein n=1 Tax=Alteromonas oceanisediminis TaxID=2836180 RepID=UPI001BDAB140|nr:cupin-like domain-containing protein [Alteromonas oceanisediminis]MBT0586288.1 cupin-like domain-containing protein [Alteromonas oceanisediminis]